MNIVEQLIDDGSLTQGEPRVTSLLVLIAKAQAVVWQAKRQDDLGEDMEALCSELAHALGECGARN